MAVEIPACFVLIFHEKLWDWIFLLDLSLMQYNPQQKNQLFCCRLIGMFCIVEDPSYDEAIFSNSCTKKICYNSLKSNHYKRTKSIQDS